MHSSGSTEIITAVLRTPSSSSSSIFDFKFDCDVVLPRRPDWTDKFIVAEGTRDVVACHSNTDKVACGVWALDYEWALRWAALDDSDPSKPVCEIMQYPNNEYEYCDAQVTGFAICMGTEHNPYFLENLGFFGQDCHSPLNQIINQSSGQMIMTGKRGNDIIGNCQ